VIFGWVTFSLTAIITFFKLVWPHRVQKTSYFLCLKRGMVSQLTERNEPASLAKNFARDPSRQVMELGSSKPSEEPKR
jgi:hypothetical protein